MQRLLAIAAIAVLPLMPLKFRVDAHTAEYEQYVHTDWLGNCTHVEKPVFPVYLNESHVPIGQNWTVVCLLQANHSYHVYCYGAGVHTGAEPKTDDDIYVYNPEGALESMQTEAAGLPEHLGTTVDDPLFCPCQFGKLHVRDSK